MAEPLANFYSGAMAPPDKLNGKLVQSIAQQPATLADMYRDILPGGAANAGGGLTTRMVDLYNVDRNGDPILTPEQRNARDVVANRPASVTAAAAPTINAASPLDISQLGLTASLRRPAAVAAIDAVAPTSLAQAFGSSYAGGWGSDGWNLPSMNGVDGMQWSPVAPAGPSSGGDPWGGMRLGGAPSGGSPGYGAAPRAPAPPQTPVQSLASMFTPQPSAYSQMDPSVHAQLMAQQSPDSRGQAALRASGMLDSFGMIT